MYLVLGTLLEELLFETSATELAYYFRFYEKNENIS